ncbi:hypothetical protein Tco_0819514 [Tanacetum coccineum]|uniref:Reverse transcriptase domain-containing protein n=1 Tax=Tanacetum coccineum TaxID=301880 RepID=A0ABQ5A6S7_9ASTR
MRTRSQTRNHNSQQQSPPAVVEPFNLEAPFDNPPLVPMTDNQTMAELLQAPIEGYEDAIVIPEINANFELKHGLINLVQNKQFFGHDKEDPHAHIHMFYNALNANDQDSLNSVAGGNFLDKMPRECLKITRSNQGSLPSNTITNPKEDLKGITTRSCVAYQGPTITTSSPKVVERRTEPVDAPVSAPMPNPKPSIPYPSRRNDEKRRENANEQKDKFYEIFKDMSFEISFVDALTLMPKFASTLKALIGNKEKLNVNVKVGVFQFPADFVVVDFEPDPRVPLILGRYLVNYNDMTANRIDVVELACEEYSQEVLGFSKVIASGNPTPGYDSIVSNSSLTLTPFGDSDFLLLEEADAFLALADDPTSSEVDESYYDPKRDILILEALLNSDPSPPPNQGNYFPKIRKELKLCEAKTAKSSIDEPP